MNSLLFDVLQYLFKNYIKNQIPVLEGDSNDLVEELQQAGFDVTELQAACRLINAQARKNSNAHPSTRHFSVEEQTVLSPSCQNFIYFLENSGLVGIPVRELIINQALELGRGACELGDLKWITLMVLFSQNANDRVRYVWMHDTLTHKNRNAVIH